MSKHNYSQYSKPKANTNKPNNPNKPKLEEPAIVEEVAVSVPAAAPEVKMEPQVVEPIIENPAVTLVEETVETVTLPELVTGTVVNCAKLNVRINPNTVSNVLCVLDAGSEIQINVAASTNDWFKVCTATGIEGYCMRKFVEAKL